jgi:hypothetical protein
MSSIVSLPIIEKLYDIYKLTVQINLKLDKPHRYSLGVETEKSLLSLVELLLMAGHAPKAHKSTYLTKAQANLDMLRLRFRLYLELGLGNETTILQIKAKLEEVGRMLGGWAKSV